MAHTEETRHRAWLKVKEKRETWFCENGPCKRCNSWDSLQLDHIDPTKKISHKIWSWAALRQKEELKKCQALCQACHKQKTRNERFRMTHGIVTTYQKGCRCELCIKAYRESCTRANRIRRGPLKTC